MNIVLAGFMGTGKTVVGRFLAAGLNMRFIDIDECIVRSEHRSISKIFKQEGEPYFRKIEKKTVNKISRLNNSVISTGGGVMLDEDNVSALRRNGVIISLEASPWELLKRVKVTKSRPLLSGKSLKKTISTILRNRAPYYKKADIAIKTNGLSVDEVVRKVVDSLNELRN